MNIKINGQNREFDDSVSLKSIIGSCCGETARVIAEVNGSIIKAPQWDNASIKDGDSIELVSFVGGG